VPPVVPDSRDPWVLENSFTTRQQPSPRERYENEMIAEQVRFPQQRVTSSLRVSGAGRISRTSPTCFEGARVAHAWNVLGAILTPCSVSTRQIGATPNRSLWSAMSRQTSVVLSDVSAAGSPAQTNTSLRSGSRWLSAPARRYGASTRGSPRPHRCPCHHAARRRPGADGSSSAASRRYNLPRKEVCINPGSSVALGNLGEPVKRCPNLSAVVRRARGKRFSSVNPDPSYVCVTRVQVSSTGSSSQRHRCPGGRRPDSAGSQAMRRASSNSTTWFSRMLPRVGLHGEHISNAPDALSRFSFDDVVVAVPSRLLRRIGDQLEDSFRSAVISRLAFTTRGTSD
jgi:hypothetical protein